MEIKTVDDIMNLKRTELMQLASQQGVGFTPSDSKESLQGKIIDFFKSKAISETSKPDPDPVPADEKKYVESVTDDKGLSLGGWQQDVKTILQNYIDLGVSIEFDENSWTLFYGEKSTSGNKTVPQKLILRAAQLLTGRSFE